MSTISNSSLVTTLVDDIRAVVEEVQGGNEEYFSATVPMVNAWVKFEESFPQQPRFIHSLQELAVAKLTAAQRKQLKDSIFWDEFRASFEDQVREFSSIGESCR